MARSSDDGSVQVVVPPHVEKLRVDVGEVLLDVGKCGNRTLAERAGAHVQCPLQHCGASKQVVLNPGFLEKVCQLALQRVTFRKALCKKLCPCCDVCHARLN